MSGHWICMVIPDSWKTAGKRCLIGCVVILALLLALVLAVFLWYVIDTGAAAVETDSGTIKGSVVWGPGGYYVEEYLGIPYAYAPIDELRWAKPLPYRKYEGGSLAAYEMKDACWGFKDLDEEFEGKSRWYATNKMSEDCLYLNVWVPRPERTNRAVMVWIHGGGYQMGSSDIAMYNGRALAEFGDVVVVTINYRLGVFGFISTGDNRIKGNYGLLDQREALRWVKKNIKYFGGDPNLVTIFGQSAGAASVGFHALASGQENLFKRVIQQSGSATSPLAMTSDDKAGERSAAFFQRVSCDDDDAVLDCLRRLSAETVFEKSRDDDLKFLELPWVPVVDGEYLTETSAHLLEEGDYPRYDAMIGVTANEGTVFLEELEDYDHETSSELTRTQYDKAMDEALWQLSPGVRNKAKRTYEKRWPQGSSRASGAERRDLVEEIFADWTFICPAVNLTLNYSAHGSKVFFYYLTHRASNEIWPSWAGVTHYAHLQWVFGEPYRHTEDDDNPYKPYTEDEKKFSLNIMTYWSNFAKYGDPNGGDLPYWPLYSPKHPAYMEFGNETTAQPHKEPLPRSEHCKMWAKENDRRFKSLN